MNYISLSTRLILSGLIIALCSLIFPLAVSAQNAVNYGTNAAEMPRSVKDEPLRPSELASFVLSAAALVTAGIALSRTRKRHHS